MLPRAACSLFRAGGSGWPSALLPAARHKITLCFTLLLLSFLKTVQACCQGQEQQSSSFWDLLHLSTAALLHCNETVCQDLCMLPRAGAALLELEGAAGLQRCCQLHGTRAGLLPVHAGSDSLGASGITFALAHSCQVHGNEPQQSASLCSCLDECPSASLQAAWRRTVSTAAQACCQ